MSPLLWRASVAVAVIAALFGCGCGGRSASANGGATGSGGDASVGAGSGGASALDASTSGTDGGADASSDSGVSLPTTDRTKTQLQNGWRFIGSNSLTGAQAVGFDDSAWAVVSVPHTWDSVTAPSNRLATFSNARYRTTFPVAASDAGKRFYLSFEGVFQIADVYVNGQHLGQHRGGYTRFIFDATAAVVVGNNVVAVQVSNADCADCLPDINTRLFKGYGGIYRKAWLVTTSPYHVATTDFGSSGVYVTPTNVSATSATVNVKTMLSNDGSVAKVLRAQTTIRDGAGNTILTGQADETVAAGATVPITQQGTITNPDLWSPATPNLYSVVVQVSVDGAVTDAVQESIGLRSYQLTTTDFTLNGVSTRLRGVAKHQETEVHASAVTDDELIADWDNLRELGVNFVRMVHYPHAQLEYDLADQRGIMVWSENGQTNSGPPSPNGDTLTREMVYQNWNHPSVIFWSAGNEAPGVAATSEYAAVIHAADPSRPVVYGSNGQTPTSVDFLFHNTYAGWYGGTMYDWITAGDRWVSEAGAGMSIATHTADAFATSFTVDSFEPEDYGALVNEVRFDDLFRRPTHVPAFAGWVFRDISDVKYKGLLNTKGLITFGGYKKDVFYHFESLLQRSPVLHLVAPHYFLRAANPAGQGAIKAYSNAATLSLSINGQSVGSLANNQYTHPNGTPIADVFYWPDALQVGRNAVSISDGMGNSDVMTVYYLGTGTTVPPEATAKVQNVTSSVGQAYFINRPVADQQPFYFDFDGSGDNTFDVIPPAVAGAGWIATRRQSDATKQTNLAFDLPTGADVFIMFTTQPSVPAWITSAGFTDTGTTGRWRDNSPKLVGYSLYTRTFAAADHVALTSSAIDYVVLVK